MRPGHDQRVRDRLDATALREWCAAGLDALRRHQREIDDLNVYPVPDGDTGTNLVLTFAAGSETVAGPDAAGLGELLRRLARGALLGARGNSGVILAQLLGGIAAELATAADAGGRELTAALVRAADAAYAAVAEPVEGTMLSVARAAAEAASARGTDDLAQVCTVAATGAAQALARTPEQLPVLARAGVVDAGGRGLVLLFDALATVVTGSAPSPAPVVAPGVPAAAGTAGAVPARGPALRVAARETGSDAYAYEVQYLLDAPDAAVGPLRAELGGLGDSLVVVGDGAGVWNVHVHVNDIGAAIEAGIRAGRPHRISVTRFADQVPAAALTNGAARPAVAPTAARGVVVVVEGTGIAALFAAEGATVVDAGPAANPSTTEVLTAIRATGAGEVVVLPGDADCQAVAALAAAGARREGIQVAVVPTRSPMQAVAALAVRDPERRFDDDVIAMAEAAGATRCAEVTVAARDALTSAGRCGAGDVLALVEGEVVLVAPGPAETALAAAAAELLDRMLSSGGELVTLVLGDSAPDGLGEELRRHVARSWPLVEVQSFFGGQPHHPLLVGVE
ncbi:MAG TPA: DAK2 domain-containing protein [Mycobacteriales bacterium]